MVVARTGCEAVPLDTTTGAFFFFLPATEAERTSFLLAGGITGAADPVAAGLAEEEEEAEG